MKPNSKPYDTNTLSTHYTYNPPKTFKTSSQNNWWNKFHDPQLNQLITIALADSPNMLTAQARVNKAIHLTEESKSSLWPSLDFSGYATRDVYTQNWIYPSTLANTPLSNGFAALNFQYDLDFWGKNRETIASQVNETYAASADAAAARLLISTSVASTYFQLQSTMALYEGAKLIAQQRQAIQKIVQIKAAHGIQSDIPLATAQANTRTANITESKAKEAVLLSHHQLAALMGKNPLTTDIKVHPFIYNAKILNLPRVIPANLLARRPDIAASRWRVESAAHLINVAKARFFPDINLSGFFGYQAIGLNRLFTGGSRTEDIQAAIDLPIFDANARKANLNTRFAEYDIAVNQYNQTIINALHEVADQMSVLDTVKSQQSAQEQVLNNTKKTYHLTQAQYEHGIADYSQLLQLKETLLSEEQIQIQLQARHILTIIAMIKALGGDYPCQGDCPA